MCVRILMDTNHSTDDHKLISNYAKIYCSHSNSMVVYSRSASFSIVRAPTMINRPSRWQY